MNEQLTHRSCSRCLYWSFVTKRVNNGVIESICDYSVIISDQHKFTSGGYTCGQWKKRLEGLKYE